MANSSDWLGALAAPPMQQPGWLALLGEPGGFDAALPFGAPAPVPAAPPSPGPGPDPAELAAADARARAYADGEAAGRAAALAEADAHAARQRALRLAFRTLDEAARDVLAGDLAETVSALCDAALAGAAIDREALMARCHAAARRIGGAAAALRLHLHPDDIAMLGEAALAGWALTPDPALARGALLIEGPDGLVSDGPAEWRRAIAAAVRG